MQEGATYTINIDSKTETDRTEASIKFAIFESRSEAIHVNIAGYSTSEVVKSADVYMWMGDGQARNYQDFTGNKVYLYNIDTKTQTEVGTLEFWKASAQELIHHNFTRSSVWIADFNTHNVPSGVYRLAIEGIGCSDNF